MRCLLLAVLLLVALAAPAAATVPLAEDHYTAVEDVDADDPKPRRPEHTIRYRVGFRGIAGHDRANFREIVEEALTDPRGWSLGGAVRFDAGRSDPDIHIWLASPSEVAAAHPTCDELFSCRVEADVYINVERWRHGATGKWQLPLDDYRRYVVNHEVGHWLGLQHRGCPARDADAPVMLQQTIDLQGCRARVWPLPGELRRVQQLLGRRP